MKRLVWVAMLSGLLLSMSGTLLVAQDQKAQPSGKDSPAPQAAVKSRPLPRMVDIGKTWCIPCKKMVAVLQEAELRYKGKALIEFVDLEKNPDAADQYKIQMIPTQIFYTAEGKEFERHMGFLPFEDVEKIFKKIGVDRSN